jgi:hypothetical protein
MNKQSLFKSGFNVAVSILFCFIVYFTFDYIVSLSENIIIKYVIYLFSPLLLYFALYNWVNRCYFYEEYIEIKYFFRFRRRIIRYNYDEITKIKYVCTDSRYSQPTLTIEMLKIESSNKTISFSFPVKWYKNRKKILRFLATKGLSIEINSVKEKDLNILS